MRISPRSGQSLIDVLIASALGALLLVGALSVLAPALRGGSDAEHAQDGAAAARGMIDGVRSLAASDWSALFSLTPGNSYHLTYSSTSTTVVPGVDTSMATTTGILRAFSVAHVRRNSGGAVISSGGYVDSSTLALSVAYSAPHAASRTISTFLTRTARSNAIFQTDWSGGTGQTSATTTPGNTYASSTGLNVSTTTGSVLLVLPQ